MKRIITLTLCLLITDTAYAKMNKCKDANGKITYSSFQCPSNEVAIKHKIKKESGVTKAHREANASKMKASANAEELRVRSEAMALDQAKRNRLQRAVSATAANSSQSNIYDSMAASSRATARMYEANQKTIRALNRQLHRR